MLIETPKDYAPRGIKIAKIDDMSSEEFTETKEKFSKMGHFSASSTPGLLGLYGGPDRVFKQMRGWMLLTSHLPRSDSGNSLSLMSQTKHQTCLT